MLRRWCIPLAGLGLVLGMLAVAGPAAAAPAAHRSAAHLIRPAAHLVRPTGHGTRPFVAHGGPANAASSTNWSGYAAASSTYRSVSASCVRKSGTPCSISWSETEGHGRPRTFVRVRFTIASRLRTINSNNMVIPVANRQAVRLLIRLIPL